MNPTERRLQLLGAGFEPIPVNGKAAVMNGWQHGGVSPEQIRVWEQPRPKGYGDARNTGILTRLTPTLDLDILTPEAAAAAEQLVRDRFGEDGAVILVRFGRAPKRAIPFRTAKPFPAIKAHLLAAHEGDGTRPGQHIELLGDGQQIVVDGIHPDTKQRYGWQGGLCVGDIQHDELPEISAVEAKALVEDLADLVTKEHGYRLINSVGQPINKIDPDRDAGGTSEPLEWPAFGDLIDHDHLTSFAMKLLKAGMHPAAIKNMLRHFIAQVPSIDRSRRERRLSEIGGIVNSGEWELRRIAAAEQTKTDGQDDLGEWDAGDEPGAIPPRQWLLGNQFCCGFISSLFAAGGVGKSALRLVRVHLARAWSPAVRPAYLLPLPRAFDLAGGRPRRAAEKN
jgi:hypothetical protein